MSGRFIGRLWVWGLVCAQAGVAWAEDKQQFNLFTPTPRDLMRELATDRPDKTESPYTVDAGHVQIEMDVVSYSTDRHNPERTDERVQTMGLALENLKLGLLNNMDLQIVAESFVWQRTED